MIAGLFVWLAVSSTGNLTISELEKTAQARLALYDSSLRAAIDRYRYLPYVVSRHHQVIDAVSGLGNVQTHAARLCSKRACLWVRVKI